MGLQLPVVLGGFTDEFLWEESPATFCSSSLRRGFTKPLSKPIPALVLEG